MRSTVKPDVERERGNSGGDRVDGAREQDLISSDDEDLHEQIRGALGRFGRRRAPPRPSPRSVVAGRGRAGRCRWRQFRRVESELMIVRSAAPTPLAELRTGRAGHFVRQSCGRRRQESDGERLEHVRGAEPGRTVPFQRIQHCSGKDVPPAATRVARYRQHGVGPAGAPV